MVPCCNNESANGISVIVCCYNSVPRLTATLQALASLRIKDSVGKEIVLVDNASTDGTGAEAQRIWRKLNSPIPFTVVSEAEPGLINARNKGIAVSKYNSLLFCDDDNWLSSAYAQRVFDILRNDASVAACGGRGVPVFDGPAPAWFSQYAEAYATGPQDIGAENGVVFNLYGAGLGIRKKALLSLESRGFRSQLHGRKGNELSSSEDTELTYAFVLAGYKLVYDEALVFQHYMDPLRLTKAYLNRLFISFGSDGPLRNLYYAYLTRRPSHRAVKNWYYHLALCLFRLFKYALVPPKANARMLYFRWGVSYLKSLIRLYSSYGSLKAAIHRIKDECEGPIPVHPTAPAKQPAQLTVSP